MPINYINHPSYNISHSFQPRRLFRYNRTIMETINLTIPNMKSLHCQMTVTNTVKAIGGNVKSISSTKAEIELTNGLTKEAVVQAIEKAGYNVGNGNH